jgi:hypothetical protein
MESGSRLMRKARHATKQAQLCHHGQQNEAIGDDFGFFILTPSNVHICHRLKQIYAPPRIN